MSKDAAGCSVEFPVVQHMQELDSCIAAHQSFLNKA